MMSAVLSPAAGRCVNYGASYPPLNASRINALQRVPYTGYINEGEFQYFVINIPNDLDDVFVTLNATSIGGDPDMFLSLNETYPASDVNFDPMNPTFCTDLACCTWKSDLYGSEGTVPILHTDPRGVFHHGNLVVAVYGYIQTEFLFEYYLQITTTLCEQTNKIVHTADCLALVDLYTYCGGGVWQTNWLTPGTDPCMAGTPWDGVTCNSTLPGARVVGLDLHSRGLSNCQLRPSFGGLAGLQFLDLSTNQISGPIPDGFWYITMLQNVNLSANLFTGALPLLADTGTQNFTLLDLSYNQLTGRLDGSGYGSLNFFSEFSNFWYLDLSHNQFSGVIPASIVAMRNLTYLDISYNQLTGSLPSFLSQFPGMRVFRASNNALTGTIPLWIGNWTALEQLDLSSNQFSGNISIPFIGSVVIWKLRIGWNLLVGSIPSWIGALTSLWNLGLEGNSFSGEIPPFLANLQQLRVLHLQQNMFSGSFPAELGSLLFLSDVSFCCNNLTGPLPTSLQNWARSVVSWSISFNMLSGGLPANIASFMNLKRLNCEGSRLSGIIPSAFWALPNLQYVNLENNDFEGILPSQLGQSLKIVLASQNRFSGMFPTNFGSNATSPSLLEHFHFRGNWLSGPLDHLNFLTTPSLASLDVSFNNLNGSVDGSIEGLAATLQQFDVSSNRLDGVLSPGWTSLTAVYYFNMQCNRLTGNVTSTGYFQTINVLVTTLHFGNVQQFSGYNNDLSGLFPLDLGYLTGLSVFHLGGNLVTGTVADNFAVVGLTEFDVVGNMLSGSIPPSLAQLSLVRIWLSNNLFSGIIPSSFSGLYLLQSVQIANNQLTGGIPSTFWSGMTQLLEVFLPFNNLLNNIGAQVVLATSLLELDVGNNKFSTTSVQPELWTVTSLQYLVLENNMFSVETVLWPKQFQCHALQRFWMANNLVKGVWHPTVSSDLPQLVSLDITNNLFSGSYLVLLQISSLAELLLSNNLFSEPFAPTSANSTGLQVLDISMNAIAGTMTGLGTYLQLEELALFSNAISLLDFSPVGSPNSPIAATFANVTVVSAGANVMQNDMLALLLSFPNCQFVSLSSNNFQTGLTEGGLSGANLYFPSLEWMFASSANITSSTFDLLASSLSMLSLNYGQLSGRMPVQLFSSPNLLFLSASHQLLEDVFPSVLTGSPNLLLLDLSHNQLTAISFPMNSGIHNNTVWMQLMSLDLSANAIAGNLPSSFFTSVLFVERLILSNNMILMDLPANLSLLTSLVVLDLSSNFFLGPIPNQLGLLHNLTLMNLANNNLTGFIPPFFQFVTYSVDLSGSLFRCAIPNYASIRDTASCRCPDGFYTLSKFSPCRGCLPGTYSQSQYSLQECQLCPAGQYQNLPLQKQCILCPLGQFTSNPGSVSCNLCPFGSMSNQLGQSSCYTCAAGQYARFQGSYTCVPCPVGYFSGQGEDFCLPCPSGSFSQVEGSSNCTSCPAGTSTNFMSATSLSECACAAGSIGPAGGPCFETMAVVQFLGVACCLLALVFAVLLQRGRRVDRVRVDEIWADLKARERSLDAERRVLRGEIQSQLKRPGASDVGSMHSIMEQAVAVAEITQSMRETERQRSRGSLAARIGSRHETAQSEDMNDVDSAPGEDDIRRERARMLSKQWRQMKSSALGASKK